jgi:hypothetical protein
MPTRATAALRPGLTSEPMTYHGGRLKTAPAHVYLVWYGDGSGRPAVPVLTDLVRGFGGSAYAATNATYTDGSGRHVTTDVTLAGSLDDTCSHARTLTDAAVRSRGPSCRHPGRAARGPERRLRRADVVGHARVERVRIAVLRMAHPRHHRGART